MRTVKVWDIFVRAFHWTLVGSIIGMYLTGEDYKGVHIRLGYFLACLILARVIWGFIGTRHARFKDFLYRPGKIVQYLKSLAGGNPTHYLGHNPAGGLMIIIMLLCLFVTVFTGLKALADQGQGPLADTKISIIRTAYADEDEHDAGDGQKKGFWAEIHEFMTGFMIFLIIVHIGGVVVSSWVHKENLILAMINGEKKVQ